MFCCDFPGLFVSCAIVDNSDYDHLKISMRKIRRLIQSHSSCSTEFVVYESMSLKTQVDAVRCLDDSGEVDRDPET